ncbi:MAG: hypothetical protein JST06_06185 [Bacteroidetes bacterium]|nr:hypothetical protein [Bacteroidota bacterium]
MKTRLIFLLLFLLGLPGIRIWAQSGPYGNEWIDYSKTYYKFKVGSSGFFRIYRSTLNAAGLPTQVVGSNFMLFRDGKELPVYVSAETMLPNDYIQFWGDGPDGSLDQELYQNPNDQPNDQLSLFTDSASYFLCYDNGNNHLRFASIPNNIPVTPPAAAPYCLATVRYSATNTWMPGPSYAGSIDLWSPSFDAGEGYINGKYGISSVPSINLATPNLVPGVNGQLNASVIVRSFDYTHQLNLLFNGSQLATASAGVAEAKHFSLSVPAASLTGNNQLKFQASSFTSNGNPSPYDYFGISGASLEYPRNFDMSGLQQARFSLPATGSAQYLEFSNLGAARLFDITNQKWYAGNTAIAGKTRFYLDPSVTTRDFCVLSDAATGIPALSPLKEFQFTNWNAQQGNYIIISHPDLMRVSNGRNYVDDYAQYRHSATGGNWQVQVADITELYDEFAYGQDLHPLAIQRFLHFAYDNWSIRPEEVFLIGRGILYTQRKSYAANRSTYPFPVVPTYGIPGSDLNFVMFNGVHQPRIGIGRLSVWTPDEIGVYLDKVKSVEQQSAPAAFPSVASEMWKKRVMHLIGTGSDEISQQVMPTMIEGAKILADTFTGRHTYTFAKGSSAQIEQVNALLVDSLLRGGLSQISFYGHGSPVLLDYELPPLNSYNNSGRVINFLALGCDVSQMFDITINRTITENYILSPNSGALTMLASCNLSFVGFDDYYLYAYYRSVASKNYGGTMGTHANFAYDSVTNNYIVNTGSSYPNSYSTQLESIILAGDPAVRFPSPSKPDFFLADYNLAAVPGNVSTSMDSFGLRVESYNLGKAVPDTVLVRVEHTNPAGATSVIASYTIPNLFFSDTSLIKIPVNKIADLGLNKYKVTIDAADKYDEVSEMNNTANLQLFIYSDNLVPVYPKEFAIVHNQGLTLKASILNAFRGPANYRIEMDTTILFNSPLKVSTRINSAGGVVKWKPDVQYRDSVVYYWRTALDSPANDLRWSNSSFVYLDKGSEGWNQSHFFQYQRDYPQGLDLDSDRVFHFPLVGNSLEVKNIVLCWDGNCNSTANDMQTFYNNSRIEQSSHSGVWNALSILVIDPATARIWMNSPSTTYGSTPPRPDGTGSWSRQFNLASQAGRIAAARFIDTIPDGDYIVVKNAFWHGISSPIYCIPAWKADTTVTGPGRSLYNSLYNLGFTKIDSFYRERVFIFMCRKNTPSFPIYQAVTDNLSDILRLDYTIEAPAPSGQYRSTVIGPAKSWQELKWKTFPLDTAGINDTATIAVIGVDKQGNETTLMPDVTGDTSLSNISVQQYPYLRLLWTSKDSISLTSPQLAYWRVLYQPVPEAALNPASFLSYSDSVSAGQTQNFSTAIENLTDLPMDSMLVRYRIVGANGTTHNLADIRYKPLAALDTIHVQYSFDPSDYPGSNLLFVEANPDDDQPEQYHPNNLGYLPFRVGIDTRNPLLDVTFDGIHILNGDIVSAKPFIKVMLKDENKFQALNDTSMLQLSLRTPADSFGGNAQPIPFDGQTCRFIPANPGGTNEAYIEYRPTLSQDGTYQLVVSGHDRAGNIAGGTSGNIGSSDYKISFTVDNKPSITRLLNYPNPFSTATAFVFTLTGSQIPSQLKIQILTVTGKVVREITRAELGPLHIGRNITEYKWDGRDQYGQLLGNGVYLYRVVTMLNGQDVDIRTDDANTQKRGSGIDRFFHNGWGKMYIMR